jgi:hypothetical protein
MPRSVNGRAPDEKGREAFSRPGAAAMPVVLLGH